MREVEEREIWGKLAKKFQSLPAENVTVGEVTFDLSAPCTVVGGRNGTGKSRVLRELSLVLGERSLFIDLYALCEQALSVLRSRADIDDLKDEVEQMPMDQARFEDLERIVGRKYERIGWYGLDVVPGDDAIAERFTWGSDQPIVPYFEARYRGVDYSSATMGLGELSAHLLFWILQQYDQTEELVVLLDEPDAYLPPVAASALLARILKLLEGKKRGWRVVLTTHSADIISSALEQDAFTLLSVNQSGLTTATHSTDDPLVANVLLSRPPIQTVMFVEDESAYHLARALVGRLDPQIALSVSIVWGKGFGYMVGLRDHLPRSPRAEIKYALAFDGDQRENDDVAVEHEHHWPTLFLPTSSDPDTLFTSVATSIGALSARLGRSPKELERVIASLEGEDAHDWVNKLGEHFDRSLVLHALADLWVEQNPDAAVEFQEDMLNSLKRSRPESRRRSS
jgi:hypothetical protein